MLKLLPSYPYTKPPLYIAINIIIFYSTNIYSYGRNLYLLTSRLSSNLNILWSIQVSVLIAFKGPYNSSTVITLLRKRLNIR